MDDGILVKFTGIVNAFIPTLRNQFLRLFLEREIIVMLCKYVIAQRYALVFLHLLRLGEGRGLATMLR